MLGVNRTHHMLNIIADDDASGREYQEWARALRAKYRDTKSEAWTRLDWDRLLGDCQATIDYPSALFAADLARAYPEAKVIMLNRDPEKWYESMSSTVAALKHPGLWHSIKSIYCWLLSARVRGAAALWTEVANAEGGYDHFKEKNKAIAFMKSSYDEVRQVVDRERRIEWTVQDGWEPLCRHLGVDVPMVKDEATGETVVAPFPRVNDRESFRLVAGRAMEKQVAEANAVVYGLVGRGVVVAAVGYGLLAAWRAYAGGDL